MSISSADDGRRRVRIFAFGIAFLFGAVALLNWWTERDNLRENSVVVSETGERLPIDEIPTTYRAVFRSENRAGDALNVTTEKVWMKRPFASRIESFTNAGSTGEPSTVRQSAFGLLTSVSEGTPEPLNIAVTPSLASGDLRPDAVLDEAIERKTILVREQREVYGRRCQVYRAGSSILAGDLSPYEPGSGDYADVCIDRHGIVIEEYWVQDNELLRRRAATDLDVDIPLSNDLFDAESDEPTPDRGVVARIDQPPSEEGLPLWTLPKRPKGFDRLGRYGVTLSRNAVPSLGGERPEVGPSSTSDVYVRGADLIVVDQDPSLATIASFDARPVRKLKLDGLKDGKLIVDARMSEVRGSTGDGSLVRLFGTVPPQELIDLANTLRPSPSGK